MKNIPGYLILNRSVSLPLLMVVTTACVTGEALRPIVHQTGGGRLGMRPARVAILVPQTGDPMLVSAYARLDVETDQIFQHGLDSQVVERSELPAVQAEQRWQYGAPAAEDTTARLGRLLGADALVLYRITIPALRERLLASEGTPLPPVTIVTKVIRVETGEEVWSHMVAIEVVRGGQQPVAATGFDPVIGQAVHRGVEEALAAVAEAVMRERVGSQGGHGGH